MEYLEALSRWQYLKELIATAQGEERTLREGLFTGTFPQPHEGVNEYTLPDGRVVKGTYKINRSLDEDKLDEAIKAAGLTKKAAPTRTKVELDVKKWRALPDEARNAFSICVTEKPGLPTLDVVVPDVAAAVAPFSGD